MIQGLEGIFISNREAFESIYRLLTRNQWRGRHKHSRREGWIIESRVPESWWVDWVWTGGGHHIFSDWR